jgi:hypothetical protein
MTLFSSCYSSSRSDTTTSDLVYVRVTNQMTRYGVSGKLTR